MCFGKALCSPFVIVDSVGIVEQNNVTEPLSGNVPLIIWHRNVILHTLLPVASINRGDISLLYYVSPLSAWLCKVTANNVTLLMHDKYSAAGWLEKCHGLIEMTVLLARGRISECRCSYYPSGLSAERMVNCT
jgi:hypothetical protein